MPEPIFSNLDVLPRHAYPFLWADYVELLCLCSPNQMVSRGNMQATEQEAEDLQVDAGVLGEDAPYDAPDHHLAAVKDDKISARWDDIALKLRARAASFPGWPFELDGAVLRCKYDSTRADHRLYVALLVASSLRLCSKQRSGTVTSAFEEISYHWMRQSLTPLWQVRPFGAHATLPNAYVGHLRAKLEALAQDIRARLQKDADDYDPADTGDAGIDLVAWQEVGDKRGNIPVVFGQCACSPTDWEGKQLDVTPGGVESHIAPDHPAAAYCFVPHDLSSSEQKWERAAHVKKCVLVDRKRLLNLFKATDSVNMLPAWEFVGEAASTRYAPAA